MATITDGSINMWKRSRRRSSESFANAQITLDKFLVGKVVNKAIDGVRRAKQFPDQAPAPHFPLKMSITTDRGERGAGLISAEPGRDTRLHIHMNLQPLFTTEARTARPFLNNGWKAWVQICDLAAIKKLAKTIMAKSVGILRSTATALHTAFSKPSCPSSQSARPKATAPSENSWQVTYSPAHPLETARSQ